MLPPVTVHDPYFYVVEVTIHGQARFYNPAASRRSPPPRRPSPRPRRPPADATKAEGEPAKKDDAAKKEETPKDEAAKKAEEPKGEDAAAKQGRDPQGRRSPRRPTSPRRRRPRPRPRRDEGRNAQG